MAVQTRLLFVLFGLAAWCEPAACFQSSSRLKLRLHRESAIRIEQAVGALLLFDSVQNLVPSELQELGTVDVEFRNLGGHAEKLLSCSQESSHITAFVEPTLSGQARKIVVDRSLLDLLKSDATKRLKSCRHQTAEKFVQSVVLHELAHVFDESRSFAALERRDRVNCLSATPGSSLDGGTSLESFESCEAAQAARGGISESRFYRHATAFQSSANNYSLPRTPDSYEVENVREHFAVNFEYFVLDPLFAQKRPQTASIFAKIFNTESLQSRGAKPLRRSAMVLDAKSDHMYTIDVNRIFEIDYLQAESGSQLMSRWGHSMFRLVICDKSRSQVDAKCRRDVASHLIVGFGAVSPDGVFNHLQGLTGRYPSQLEVTGFLAHVQQYTDEEFRDVTSTRLKLSRDEIQAFVAGVLQRFWEYRGRYRFLSNNCTTESFRFLRTALASDHRLQSETWLTPTTPTQLYDLLVLNDLLDIQNQERFPSKRRVLELALETALPATVKMDLNSYAALKPERRQQMKFKTTEKRALAARLLLERWIGKRAQTKFLADAIRNATVDAKHNGGDTSTPGTLETERDRDYGIPADADLTDALVLSRRTTRQVDLARAFDAYAVKNRQEYEELLKIKESIESLQRELLHSMAN